MLAKIAYAAGVDPVTLLAGRFGIAGLCMVGVLRGGRYSWPRGHTLFVLIGLGAVCYVTQSLLYFVALTVASGALVALLLYVYPAIVTVVAAVLFREPLSGVKVVALVIALGGTALTIGVPEGSPLGIVLALGAAVAYAVYILLSSRVGPRAGAIPSATVVMLSAGVVLTVVALVRGPQLPDSAAGWAALVGLALISTVIAIVTFFAGLERIGPAEASTVSTTEPVTAVLLAAVVLGEPISTGEIVGGTLIVMAVILMARAGRPDLVPEEAPPA